MAGEPECGPPPGSPDTSPTNLERQGRIALTLSLFRRASFVNRITANRRLGAASFRRVLRWRVLLRSPRAWAATRPRAEGPAHAFLLGQCRKGHAGAADQYGIEAMRPDQQLDQARIGFRGGKRVARKLLLNHVPQRLVDDRRVFGRMGLPLVNVATEQEAIGI